MCPQQKRDGQMLAKSGTHRAPGPAHLPGTTVISEPLPQLIRKPNVHEQLASSTHKVTIWHENTHTNNKHDG